MGLEGFLVRAATTKNILNRNRIGSRYEQWLWLERETVQKEIELTTAEQVALIEKQSPSFKERQYGDPYCRAFEPGHLLREIPKRGGQARFTCKQLVLIYSGLQ
jgi:hypothetical protein